MNLDRLKENEIWVGILDHKELYSIYIDCISIDGDKIYNYLNNLIMDERKLGNAISYILTTLEIPTEYNNAIKKISEIGEMVLNGIHINLPINLITQEDLFSPFDVFIDIEWDEGINSEPFIKVI